MAHDILDIKTVHPTKGYSHAAQHACHLRRRGSRAPAWPWPALFTPFERV